MSKKKRTTDSEENTDVLDLDELSLEEDLDDEDFDLSEEEEEEKTEELDLKAPPKPKSKKPSKKKKKSTSKKKKTVEQDEPTAEDSEELEAPPEMEDAPKPKKKARSKIEQSEEDLLSKAAMQSMESMAKQWQSVKETSDAISSNFENLSKMLRELPASYSQMLDEIARKQKPQASVPTKIALGLSTFSFVLAFIALLFSQSIRQSVLSHPAQQNLQSYSQPLQNTDSQRSDLRTFTERSTKGSITKKPTKRRKRRSRRKR